MKQAEQRYFAAANTEKGFISLFNPLFSGNIHKKVYIIKGGPGTGKSTFMRKIAKRAENMGLKTEYYYCSSDPSSLDAVVIPALSAAVVDGTAPHLCDPVYPAAAESVISFYPALNSHALYKEKEEIIALISDIADDYKRVYRFLLAAGKMESEAEETAGKAWKKEKAEAAIERLLRHVKGNGKESRTVFSDAIGTSGIVHFDTFEQSADKVIYVNDRFELGSVFLSCLSDACDKKGAETVKIPEALRPSRLSALYIVQTKTLFTRVKSEYTQKNINIMRFTDADILSLHRNALRFTEKCRDSLLKGAVDILQKIGEKHRALEKIYGTATDFSVVESIEKETERDIFDGVL